MWEFNYWNYTLRRKFIDVKTMKSYSEGKMVILKNEKTMKSYSEAVILSL